MIIYEYLRLHIFFISLSNVLSKAPSTLELVTLLFRHGDRSPTQAYPTDPHQEDAWPQGYGQLTQKGMNQAHNLGQFLRGKYEGFLSDNYSRNEIYVQSTDYDRTLMTAQSVLAGLYPPSGQQKWNENITWQPIPIHTMPLEYDSLLQRLNTCDRLREERKAAFSSPFATEFNKKYQGLSDFLREKSGYQPEQLTNILSPNVTRIWDTSLCERENGLEWPAWLNQTIFDILFYEVNPNFFGLHFYSDIAKRLTGGRFIKQAIEKMQLKIDSLLDKRYKMFMYSAHDGNIATTLGALNLFNYKPIPYTVAIMFELHNDKNTGRYVQLWLRNETGQPPIKLTLPGCQPDCPLDNFISLTKKVTPDDWFTECISEEALNHLSPAGILLLSIVGVVTFIVIMTIILSILLRKKCEKHINIDPAVVYVEREQEAIPEEAQTMLDNCSSEDEL